MPEGYPCYPARMEAVPPQAEWRVAHPTVWPALPSLDGWIEPGADAFPVHVTIRQDGVVTGWDDGALGFDEEAVWFSGQATSFRIVAADIAEDDRRWSLSDAFSNYTEIEITLRYSPWRLSLTLRALAHDGRVAAADIQIVKRRLSRLSSGAMDTSQYPPLVPRPGLLPSREASRRYGFAYLALIVFFLIGVFTRGWFLLPFFVLGLGALNHFTRLFEIVKLERIAREETG